MFKDTILSSKMDQPIIVEHTYDSIYSAAEYLLGICVGIDNKRLAIVDIDTCSPEMISSYEQHDLIIPVPEKIIGVRFTPQKSQLFANKIDKLYSLLEAFIREKCVIKYNRKITAAALLSKFSTEIGETVGNKTEFPMLMKRYMESNPRTQIEKCSTAKGIIYSGIDIRKYASIDNRVTINNNNQEQPSTNTLSPLIYSIPINIPQIDKNITPHNVPLQLNIKIDK